jgi:hypothetical protein
LAECLELSGQVHPHFEPLISVAMPVKGAPARAAPSARSGASPTRGSVSPTKARPGAAGPAGSTKVKGKVISAPSRRDGSVRFDQSWGRHDVQ